MPPPLVHLPAAGYVSAVHIMFKFSGPGVFFRHSGDNFSRLFAQIELFNRINLDREFRTVMKKKILRNAGGGLAIASLFAMCASAAQAQDTIVIGNESEPAVEVDWGALDAIGAPYGGRAQGLRYPDIRQPGGEGAGVVRLREPSGARRSDVAAPLAVTPPPAPKPVPPTREMAVAPPPAMAPAPIPSQPSPPSPLNGAAAPDLPAMTPPPPVAGVMPPALPDAPPAPPKLVPAPPPAPVATAVPSASSGPSKLTPNTDQANKPQKLAPAPPLPRAEPPAIAQDVARDFNASKIVAPAPPPAPVAAAVVDPAPRQVTDEAAQQIAALPPSRGSVLFEDDSALLSQGAQDTLTQLALSLSGGETRLQLRAYAMREEEGAAARRLSLKRALAVRAYLIDQGIAPTRIDVRALGPAKDGGPTERVDFVPLVP